MGHVVLLTGAMGTIGRGLVAGLLRETEAEVWLLLHERGAGRDTGSLLRDEFGVPDAERFAARLHYFPGDIAKPGLGLDPDEYRHLVERVNWILHSAAITRFDIPIDEARRVNVEGARETIHFARRCARLERFGFLSTAYVAGKRTGAILETERIHGVGFANSYEQSKYEAEELVETSGLPAAIYRLSTVLGDARSGRVTHFTAPHQALRMMHLGLVAMLPGTPDNRVDLLPGDFASSVVLDLFAHHFEPGKVFHITAPTEKSYTLEDIVEESYRTLAEQDPEWARRSYPRPVIAPLEAFDLFLHSAEQAENPLMQGVMKALGHFARQLAYPKLFDRSAVLANLPEYDEAIPDVRSYYRDVVRYCLETGWGRYDRREAPRADRVHHATDSARLVAPH